MADNSEVDPTFLNLNSNFEKNRSEETAALLTQGLTNKYNAPLKDFQKDLKELTIKQYNIYNNIHNQNLKLSAACYNNELLEMFTKAKLYREKAENVQKKMLNLHSRATKLKKRVLNLELQKQKESLLRAQQREKEEQLIGK